MSASSPRSWFRPQLSLGTLLMLMLVVGLGLAWWLDRRELNARLDRLEQMYGMNRQPLWSARDVLGKPDDPTGGAGKSWCPASSQGVDWVDVEFDWGVAAATIDLYETYSVGCVTEVFVVDSAGNETSIWKGTDPTPKSARVGVFSVPVPKTIKSVQRVKIVVDSVKNNGSYACLDAVGLTTAAGKTSWATSSTCSSVYGGSDLAATTKQNFWASFW